MPPIALQTELSGFAQPDDFSEAVRAYYACVSFIDHELGRILDELDRRDLSRNTLVVLFGDHGFHLGDHGGLWAKLSAFGQATRVPLIMAGPGVPSGVAVAAPVELIDVYPTLAELAGFAPPALLDGRSLGPLLRDAPPADRAAYSLVYHYDVAADRDVAGRTVIGPRWRYTEWDGGREGRELYWHADDPGEYHNRAADPALAVTCAEAASLLQQLPLPKLGPANRPRACCPPERRKDKDGRRKDKKERPETNIRSLPAALENAKLLSKLALTPSPCRPLTRAAMLRRLSSAPHGTRGRRRR